MRECSAVGDPRLVAHRRLVCERSDDHVAPLACGGLYGQGDGLTGGVDEMLGWSPARVDGVAVDGEDDITDRHGDAGSGQRRPSPRVGRIAGQYPRHRPAPIAFRGEVGAEHPLAARLLRRWRRDVCVGGTELALHLPQHVDEIVGATDSFQQWCVAVEGGVPIDASHVGAKVVVAHQPSGLVVHLPPLLGRRDRDAQTREVDGDGVVGLLRLFGGHFAVGGDDSQLMLVDDDEAGAVAGGDETVDGLDEHLDSP